MYILLGPNLILCELRKLIKNFNQIAENIITKFTKSRYQSHKNIEILNINTTIDG